jgi:hypothetical protein
MKRLSATSLADPLPSGPPERRPHRARQDTSRLKWIIFALLLVGAAAALIIGTAHDQWATIHDFGTNI